MTLNSMTAVCFKIVMTKCIFWPPIRFFASYTLKGDLTQLFTFHIMDEISGLSAEKTTPSLSRLVQNT